MMCPPPTNRVVRYWLQEIKNAKTAAIATPGAIAGSVTCRQTASGDAPRVRACASQSVSKLAKLLDSIKTQ